MVSVTVPCSVAAAPSLMLPQKAISTANEDLAQIEQVKRFAILDHDLSVDEAELTPTMKVKRHTVYDHYGDVFEGLYEEEDEDG